MSHCPQATMFFGVELVDFHEFDFENENDDDIPPYDYGWEERIAAKLNIVKCENESTLDFESRVREEVGVIPIDAGDDNHDTYTIGVESTVVNCDWDCQLRIEPDHPIFRYAAKGEGVGGCADLWIEKLQRFCDNMLNVKVDIQALYEEQKVGWRIAAYYPSD